MLRSTPTITALFASLVLNLGSAGAASDEPAEGDRVRQIEVELQAGQRLWALGGHSLTERHKTAESLTLLLDIQF